jgi:hypothetical protein
MMMRLIFLAVALVAAITFADWASSPVEPCRAPFQQRAETKQDSQRAQEYCSTGKIVALWRVAGRMVDAWHDDLTAAATVIIAVFTTILGVFTVSLARSTSIASNAAKRSADAAIAMELPFIRADPPEDLTKVENIEDDRGGLIWDVETLDLPEFSRLYGLTFRNIGRTTAAPTKLELGWKVALTLPPESPVYTWSRRCDHGTVILPGNEPFQLDCNNFCIALTAQDRSEIAADNKALWVFCALTYRNFFDETQTSRFCWRWGCPDGVGLYYFHTDEHTPAEYTAKS